MSERVADLLKQAIEALSAQSNSTSRNVPGPSSFDAGNSSSQNARECVRSLFAPYRGRRPTSTSRNTSRPAPTENWCHKFFCLYSCDQETVPSKEEKQHLFLAGLGEKRITFVKNKDAVSFQTKLFEIYPKLKTGGGFDLLRSDPMSKKELKVMRYPAGGFTSQYLADESNLNQALCYIRPIQQDLDPSPVEPEEVVSEGGLKELCLGCGEEIPVEILRKHTNSCNNENMPVVKKKKIQMKVCQYNSVDKISAQTQVGKNGDMKNCPFCHYYFEEDIIETHAAVCCDAELEKESLDDSVLVFPELTTTKDLTMDIKEKHDKEHVDQCIAKTLAEMSDIQNPKLILDTYKRYFFNGVRMDAMEEKEEIIKFGVIVDRNNVYEEMFVEIGRNEDLQYPLEVTFIGEEAADYGGPRREFLTLAVQALKENMFKGGELTNEETIGKERYLLNITDRKYEIAGTIAGLSLLEGGPAPRFFKDFDKILNGSDSKKENIDFLKGLERIGLLQLCKAKCGYLMRKLFDIGETQQVTYGYITKLLKTKFSEEGSNNNSKEKKVYRLLLDYIKEVAAHRRGSICLEDILRFVTGIEERPLLGFSHQPNIEFVNSESLLPTSSTCSCTLYLSRLVGIKDHVFSMYDYAFVNNYFGKV